MRVQKEMLCRLSPSLKYARRVNIERRWDEPVK